MTDHARDREATRVQRADRMLGAMSDGTPNTRELHKHWLLDFRLGNEITANGWDEIRDAITKLPDSEGEALRGSILGLLSELDHGRN